MTNTGEKRASAVVDAVGRGVACGDMVRVVGGAEGLLAVVHQVDAGRVLIMVDATDVVVAKQVER